MQYRESFMRLLPWLPPTSGLPGAFWMVWWGQIVNKLGTFVVPFLALYLTRERGLSVPQAGLTVSLYGAGTLVSAAWGGLVADRYGRRVSMVLGLSLGALATLHLAWARAPWHIALATLLLGCVSDAYRPGVSAFIADVIPPAERAAAYGLLYWAVNLGFSISPVLAALLVDRGFLLLFVLDAATSLVFAVLVWRKVPETRPPGTVPVSARGAFAAVLPNFIYMRFLVITFMTGLVFYQHATTLPMDMARHGLSARDYGFLIAINGILIVLFQPSVARALKRFRRSRALGVSAALVGVGFGCTALATGRALYGLSIAIWSVGEIVMAGLGPALVSDLAPAHQRGTFQGAYQIAWGFAAFLGPGLGSWVLATQGSAALWGACLVTGGACAVGHWAFGGATDPKAG